jgi:hypothetical protein
VTSISPRDVVSAGGGFGPAELEALAKRSFWLSDGRVVAGMNANVWDVTEPIRELIRSRIPVDAARLADPDEPLEDLAGTAIKR